MREQPISESLFCGPYTHTASVVNGVADLRNLFKVVDAHHSSLALAAPRSTGEHREGEGDNSSVRMTVRVRATMRRVSRTGKAAVRDTACTDKALVMQAEVIRLWSYISKARSPNDGLTFWVAWESVRDQLLAALFQLFLLLAFGDQDLLLQ